MLSWFPQSPVTSDAPIQTNEASSPTRAPNEQPHSEEALPHDRILGNLYTTDKGLNGISFKFPPNLPLNPGSGHLPRASALDTSDAIYDPFDGSFLGSILAPDHNVQPEEGCGRLNDVAAKNEELWSHLSRVLELQNQISRMHLDMEEIGPNADPKGQGKGTRSRAASVSRVVIDDEGDEGIGGKRDEEAERNKAREEQFSNLAGQFRGKKEAITAIMTKLDSLSVAVTEFHALQAPKIDFLSTRDNSLPATNTTAENQFADTRSQFNPTRKSSLPPNVMKRMNEPGTPILSESPMSIVMPLPP
ncbi:hypothetical protein DFH08DRAFT_844601 [Mycena albidolilacea]|uniref:Uncharacterized protein n=1 Tax=Mycena albidolilacea TaxID=1033008 RepID=A0AAD7AL63_9AGAR|nr:hypothetical protein DFH08DRAFT_844601 [Mycena albidolilacea]